MDLSGLCSHSKDAVRFMSAQIAHVCRNIEKRPPGSVGERKAAEHMAQILRSRCGCKEPLIETFREHPGSFYGYCRLSAVFDSLSCLGFFLHPIVSLTSGCISMLLFIFYFVLYRPVIDWMFPEKEGTNVTAVRPCKGDVRRRVLLNGHLDASWEFTLNYHFGGIVFEIPNVLALIGVTYNIALSVCSLCAPAAWTGPAARWGLLFLPFCIAIWFTYNPRVIADGANDNLTGCYMGIALLREMERHGVRLEHTEVGVVLTGSEEAGLRGSKAWAAAHRKDYRDVPTCIITFDTIHSPRCLAVNERDLNGTVRADAALSALFLKAARDAGVPCRKSGIPLFGGATDSAAFTQGGFRSVGITGLSHRLENYYHTRRDSCDSLNPEGLENCYRAAVRLVELIDQGMLDSRLPSDK